MVCGEALLSRVDVIARCVLYEYRNSRASTSASCDNTRAIQPERKEMMLCCGGTQEAVRTVLVANCVSGGCVVALLVKE